MKKENKTVLDFFDSESDFLTLLDDAEQRADDDWAITFISDIQARFEKYETNMFLTEKQVNKLQEIAEGRET